MNGDGRGRRAAVFKTGECFAVALAGSIPVRLRNVQAGWSWPPIGSPSSGKYRADGILAGLPRLTGASDTLCCVASLSAHKVTARGEGLISTNAG